MRGFGELGLGTGRDWVVGLGMGLGMEFGYGYGAGWMDGAYDTLG